jgi:hypothetical protein
MKPDPIAPQFEVLARPLALKAEHHAEEARPGIAPGTKGKAEEEEEED